MNRNLPTEVSETRFRKSKERGMHPQSSNEYVRVLHAVVSETHEFSTEGESDSPLEKRKTNVTYMHP